MFSKLAFFLYLDTTKGTMLDISLIFLEVFFKTLGATTEKDLKNSFKLLIQHIFEFKKGNKRVFPEEHSRIFKNSEKTLEEFNSQNERMTFFTLICALERDVLIKENGVLVFGDGERNFCRVHQESLEMKREREGKSLEASEFFWCFKP